MAARGDMQFLSCADSALTVLLGDVIDRETNARVQALRRAVDAAGLPGVIETIPAYISLHVQFDPLVTEPAAVERAIRGLEVDVAEARTDAARRWVLPVCFEPDPYAPHLTDVADWAGITPDEVVADITAAEQFVYMLGFSPGQPYLGDLPERLAIPRRLEPVPAIPRGSVVIATGKTVIYPASNPTGWYIVGRTPVPLYDPRIDDPILLQAGDAVRLRSVTGAEFERIEKEVAAGRFDTRAEVAG